MAAVFAAAYAVCALTPSAVLAFSGGPNSAHCFGTHEIVRQTAHVHGIAAKTSAHDHATHAASGLVGKTDNSAPDGTNEQPTGCCGMFCVSAIAPPVELTAVHAPLSSNLEPAVTSFMSGQHPSLIDRPPRALLSI